MPQSLHRAWVSLALAAAAVLVVAFLTQRDFIRDVYATCPSTLDPKPFVSDEGPTLRPVVLDVSDPASATPTTSAPGDSFRLRFDTKVNRSGYGSVNEYSNVRVELSSVDADGRPCSCGSVPTYLSGEGPYDLRLFRVEGQDAYVVKGRASTSDLRPVGDVRATFVVKHGVTSHLQTDRIFTARHLPSLVVIFALGALVFAFFRSRRAMSYAQRIHTWTEARLTPGGLIEGENGSSLGTLEQGRLGTIPTGPILVAPDALSTAGLYRDMPIVARQNVVEGDHARWSSGTLLRLRDARALAIVSTMCTMLAFAARLMA